MMKEKEKSTIERFREIERVREGESQSERQIVSHERTESNRLLSSFFQLVFTGPMSHRF